MVLVMIMMIVTGRAVIAIRSLKLMVMKESDVIFSVIITMMVER